MITSYSPQNFIISTALVELVDKRISEEDPSDPFPDLQDRIISFLGLDDKPPKACKKREGRLMIPSLLKLINLLHHSTRKSSHDK